MRKQNKQLSYFIGGVIFFMLGLSFAAVPLYRIFCQATGYGGTPKFAVDSSYDGDISDKIIKIRFNADIHRGLPWKFYPLQLEMEVHPGAQVTAFYEVQNMSDNDVLGIASYNVTPDKAGPYFNKIECFCFDEQRIKRRSVTTLPVQFFIDPDILTEHKDVKTITLSYTFYSLSDFKNPNEIKYLK